MLRLKKDTIESASHINELHYAVYVSSNPAELTEKWHMTFDENNEGKCRLDIIHEAIPLSKCKERLQEYRDEFGANVKILGSTYNRHPHCIGIKRSGEMERGMAEEIARHRFQKESRIIRLHYLMHSQPEELAKAIKWINKQPDKKYNEQVEPLIQDEIAKLLADYETPRIEAESAAALFQQKRFRQMISENHAPDIPAGAYGNLGVTRPLPYNLPAK